MVFKLQGHRQGQDAEKNKDSMSLTRNNVCDGLTFRFVKTQENQRYLVQYVGKRWQKTLPGENFLMVDRDIMKDGKWQINCFLLLCIVHPIQVSR